MEIALRPEIIFNIGSFNFTNSFLTSVFSSLLLLFILFILTRRLSFVPNFSQNLLETVFETFYNLNLQIAGERAKKVFPWFIGFFLFILFANLIGLFPGFGTVGFYETRGSHQFFIPLLRPANSDLNMTLALALISLVVTHFMSISALGIRDYLARFFSLNPINLFVGLLELVSEFTKVVSLSFRLFGNIFAGEAVLTTISKLFAFILPLPFLFLELIVGFVQALIFAMLTLVFMVILTTPHEGGEK